MHPTKILAAAAITAAALQSLLATSQELFNSAPKAKGANETIYGPLKVLEIYHFPSSFETYPKIASDIRKQIIDGGLNPTCSQCNSTGCMCPDKNSNIPFGGLCEGCRATEDGRLRCYCSPALYADPRGAKEPLTACNDQTEQCNKTPNLPYYCAPQNWDQTPGIMTPLATPYVVYDVETITVVPSGFVPMQTASGTSERMNSSNPNFLQNSTRPTKNNPSTPRPQANLSPKKKQKNKKQSTTTTTTTTTTPPTYLPTNPLSILPTRNQPFPPPIFHLPLSLQPNPTNQTRPPTAKETNTEMESTTPAHHYHFAITMTCTGCSGAVDRVLKKMEGVNRYEVSLPGQTADVYADEGLAYETVLEKIKKTGKTVTKGVRDGEDAPV
ncbi:MAG: hypothetical protein Q9173_006067 [Seirophora scorigena]